LQVVYKMRFPNKTVFFRFFSGRLAGH